MAVSTSRRVIFAALAGNSAIAATKFAAALFTGQILLLIGLRRSARPPSETHLFGHGLQLYFHTFVVAVLIFSHAAVRQAVIDGGGAGALVRDVPAVTHGS